MARSSSKRTDPGMLHVFLSYCYLQWHKEGLRGPNIFHGLNNTNVTSGPVVFLVYSNNLQTWTSGFIWHFCGFCKWKFHLANCYTMDEVLSKLWQIWHSCETSVTISYIIHNIPSFFYEKVLLSLSYHSSKMYSWYCKCNKKLFAIYFPKNINSLIIYSS